MPHSVFSFSFLIQLSYHSDILSEFNLYSIQSECFDIITRIRRKNITIYHSKWITLSWRFIHYEGISSREEFPFTLALFDQYLSIVSLCLAQPGQLESTPTLYHIRYLYIYIFIYDDTHNENLFAFIMSTLINTLKLHIRKLAILAFRQVFGKLPWNLSLTQNISQKILS